MGKAVAGNIKGKVPDTFFFLIDSINDTNRTIRSSLPDHTFKYSSFLLLPVCMCFWYLFIL